MAASAASITAVQKAYVAYYGRPADPAGLTYWSERLDSIEGEFSQMIEAFGSSDEATTLFGSLANDAKINTIYQQIFGRDADAEGLAFYSAALTDGTMTAVTIAQNIIDGAVNDDATIVSNKLTAAQSFTDYLAANGAANYVGNDAATAGRDWLSGVDATAESVTSASGSVASVIDALEPPPGETSYDATFKLTMGKDEIVGTSGNDLITGTSSQMSQANDEIDGGDGDDRVVIEVKGTFTASSIDNVETIQFDVTTFTAPTIDLSEVKEGDVLLTAVTGFSNTVTINEAGDLNYTLGSGLKTVTLNQYDEGIVNVGAGITALALHTSASTATLNLSNSALVAVTETDNIDDLNVTAVDGARSMSLEATVTAMTGDVDLQGAVTLVGGASAFVGATITGTSDSKIQINADNAGNISLEDISVLVQVDNASADFTVAQGRTVETVTAGSSISITTDDDGGTVNVIVSAEGSSVEKGTSADIMNVTVASKVVSVTEIIATSGGTEITFEGVAQTLTTLSASNLSSLVTLETAGALTISGTSTASVDASGSTGAISVKSIGMNISGEVEIITGSGNDSFSAGTSAMTSANNVTIISNAGDDTVTLTSMDANSADVYVSLGAGDDTVAFGANFDEAAGGNLVILGGDGSDKITFADSGGVALGVDKMVSFTVSGVETMTFKGGASIGAKSLTGQTMTLSSSNSSGDVLTINSQTAGASLDLSGLTIADFDTVSVDLTNTATGAGVAFVGVLSGASEVVTGVDGTDGTGNDKFVLDLGSGNDTYNVASAGGTLTLGAGNDTVAASTVAMSVFDFNQLDEHLIITDFNTTVDKLDLSTAIGVLTAGSAIDVSTVTVAQATDTVTVYLSGGIVTLAGDGAANVDTLLEWATIAHKAASGGTGGVVGFRYGDDTFVVDLVGNATLTNNNVIQLSGVTNKSLAITTGANQIDIDG